jgi:hypothetical protein
MVTSSEAVSFAIVLSSPFSQRSVLNAVLTSSEGAWGCISEAT